MGSISKLLYQDGEKIDFALEAEKAAKEEVAAAIEAEVEAPREIILQAPITEEQIRELKVGDVVRINGRMYTGRDAIHKHLS